MEKQLSCRTLGTQSCTSCSPCLIVFPSCSPPPIGSSKKARAYTEINPGGAKYARSVKKLFCFPPPRKELLGGWQNLNCKFQTFGFLDTVKEHIQSNYLPIATLSLLKTKLAEIKQQTIYLFFTLPLQI